jgi:hypothetical protein
LELIHDARNDEHEGLFTVAVSMDDRGGDATLRSLHYKFGKAVSLRKKLGIIDKSLKTTENRNFV